MHAGAAAIPLAVATGLVLALRYVDNSGSVVELAVNRMALRDFWWVTLLSFGPVMLVCAAAAPLLWKQPRGLGIFAALALSCGFFYFFVNVRDHQDVYVGWRVGHFLFMSAAVVIGVLLEYVNARPSASWQTTRRKRSERGPSSSAIPS